MNIKRIQVLTDAENDLDEGRKFYDKQSKNIGNYFWDSLLSDIESLVVFAGIHRKEFGFYRMLSKRSPMRFIMMSMVMSPPSLPCCQCEETLYG